MLSLYASSILIVAAIVVAIGWRSRRAKGIRQSELDRQINELRRLIAAARYEATRLEAAIQQAQASSPDRPGDTLARLEQLADPAAWENPLALEDLAAQLPPLPSGASADLFSADQQTMAIARLKRQGHAAPEIARELGMTLGEIEFFLSLRAA